MNITNRIDSLSYNNENTAVAVLDIGSRSISLWCGTRDKTFLENYRVTHLKEAVQDGAFIESAAWNSISFCMECIEQVKEIGVDRFLAFGTQALRSAKAMEQKKALDFFEKFTGIRPIVLTPEEESRLELCAVASKYGDKKFILADIGGASIEISAYPEKISQSFGIRFDEILLGIKPELRRLAEERHLFVASGRMCSAVSKIENREFSSCDKFENHPLDFVGARTGRAFQKLSSDERDIWRLTESLSCNFGSPTASLTCLGLRHGAIFDEIIERSIKL